MEGSMERTFIYEEHKTFFVHYRLRSTWVSLLFCDKSLIPDIPNIIHCNYTTMLHIYNR